MSGTFVGMPAFPAASAAAVANAQLRHNLRKATHTIRGKRAAVVAEQPDWAALRAAGAAIKDRTLRHLDVHLEMLEAAVTAAGGHVHWAEDAAEANRIVVDLVRATGQTEVVKVKSMATQEIDLNGALDTAGIRAYETDLAELIVQLGDDRPSHILVPAIHRNRAEIREIFLRTMAEWGRPAPEHLSDDPRALAEAARLHLRERFLSAKVGISGANFAVAQTGTLVVLESEGNGRMCLTLPETLISVVGIEKLVPTWRDLEVFMQLLPRSSTGERMNPYSSMWTGAAEGQEFHLVLLDNGRTSVLADRVGRQALRCIRCSACLNVCPVYERAGGHAYGSVYPGPIGAILTPQLRGMAGPLEESLPYASTLCGACYEVCPVAIDIPEVLLDLRAKAVTRGHRTERLAMGAARRVLGSPRWLSLAQRSAGRFRRWTPRRLPGPLSAWSDTRDVPVPPRESFRDWWARERAARRAGVDGGLGPRDRADAAGPHAEGAAGDRAVPPADGDPGNATGSQTDGGPADRDTGAGGGR